jgi:hypothetical protein
VSRSTWSLGCVLVCGAVLSGCGVKDEFSYGRVTGTVTYKGAPVEGATVSFSPSAGRTALGSTDAQGKYTLWTNQDEGCALGAAVVTIVKSEAAGAATGTAVPNVTEGGPATVLTTPAPGEGGAAPPANQGAPTAESAKLVLPARYADLSTTPLKVEVKAGDNTFDFDLTDE